MPEEQNPDRKAKRIIAAMLRKLAVCLENNPDMWESVMLNAGYNSMAEETKTRILSMLDELSGRLSR